MRNKNMMAVILCGAILLSGCGKAETGSGEMAQVGGADVTGEISGEVSGEDEPDEGGTEAGAGEGAVVIETGPEKFLYEDGNLTYTLHDFKLYDSPEEASIDQDKLMTIDARGYMDRSIFLTVQVDIKNIDFQGDGKDGEGELNVSLLTISPNEPDASLQWAGSYPVYLSEPGKDSSYYHVWVKPGETKTVTVAYYVPVKDAAQLRSQCKISLYGSYEEGYLYDIPKVQ